MSAEPSRKGGASNTRELRLERVLGRRVLARNGKAVGRIEEFRAERQADGFLVTEYVLGVEGLLERLHVGLRLLLRMSKGGRVARWDQIDLRDPEHPRLTCSEDELRKV